MAKKPETMNPAILVCLASALLVAGACSKIPNGPGGSGGTSGGGAGGAGGSASGAGGVAIPPGGTGGTRSGGTSGTPPFPIPDAGIPNLDAGLPGLIDAGLVSSCPVAPEGKMCGGQGAPFACVVEGTQPPDFCICLLGRWACPDGTPGGVPDAGIGPPMGMTCPSGAATGGRCPQAGTLCMAGMGGCICLPGAGGAASWLCSP